MKTLTVYKASAGSGKTFTLATEYIRMLVENPEAFRGILAVTFTNKATEEMKMRILSQLYGLWKGLPESESYMKELLYPDDNHSRNWTREHVSQQAGKALNLILHNYHFFRVQTIDTFFQSVLRNLARELQLNANLRVELNSKQVVEEAIDNLIDSIADDAALRSVVMGFIRERIAEGESWNFIRGIKDFGGNIFKDFYKEHRKQLNERAEDADFFKNYKSKLNGLKKQLEKKYHDIGEEALRIVEEHGLDVKEAFSYGTGGAMSYFIKMANGKFSEIDMTAARMAQAYDSPDSWVKKKSVNREAAEGLVNSTLFPLMKETEMLRPTDTRKYLSAKKTLEHVNNVWLLRYVEEFARKLNDATQRFMLSDTPTLLGEMVKDEDSPFVFEKIGAHLEHIMIDEFQDTSTVQWHNFKKLLQECMSKGGGNLIVGDVKQSIYRWRSGDWRLLNSIEREFKSGTIDFKPRKTNYRSDCNVVNFNNALFESLAKIEVGAMNNAPEMATMLEKAYSDVKQELPENRKTQAGFVHINLTGKDSEVTMEECTLDIIDTLKEKGAQLKDIAILLRSNEDAVKTAAYLKEKGISVVSAEAFRLEASAAVRIIVGMMRITAHPKDSLTRQMLNKDLANVHCGTHDRLDDIISENREKMLMMSPHDMAEEIVRLFNLGNWEGAYITTFFDRLHDFCNDTSTILEDFLEAWDSDISRQTIETPDSDGVRIMTIHKSKGLEFKHVIIPYCNWKLEQRQVIWCEPKDEPFNEMPVVPLSYSSVKAFENTIYYEDILEEHVQNMVDNLNLLYVALTRARTSLFVIGERGANPSFRSCAIEEALKMLPKQIEGLTLHISIPDDVSEDIEVSYGTPPYIPPREENNITPSSGEKEGINPFTPIITPISVDVTSQKSMAVFRQSNKSREFADDAIDETDRQRYIRMGTVMHQVFSEIATADDVLPVLQKMEYDGILYDEDITKDSLIEELRSKFQNEQVRDWFSGRWMLYNECTIISKDGEQRPDRVMTDGKETIVVDYKFGKPHSDYAEQVKSYMALLKQMGMPDVKGYLWYVTLNKIEQV